MCMSPDEMSDDRIREVAEYFREEEQQAHKDGYHNSARNYGAQATKFEGLLAERETQRAADVEEIFTATVADAPRPVAV